MRIKVAVFFIAIFLLNIRYVFCESSTANDLVATGMDNMYLYGVSPFGDQYADGLLCHSMLEDIKLNKYTVVNPIVSSDDYLDPSLRFYTEKCPDLELNITIELGLPLEMTKDFRLYHIDLDGNPKNGKEYVFYGAGMRKFDVFLNNAYFKVVDFSSCKIKWIHGGAIYHDEYVREGIMSYSGKYYIYSSEYYDKENRFTLTISEWRKIPNAKEKGRRFFMTICFFKIDKY